MFHVDPACASTWCSALQAAGVEVGTEVHQVPDTNAIVRMARELLRSNQWPLGAQPK